MLEVCGENGTSPQQLNSGSSIPSSTYSPSFSQMARATRNNISEPSKNTESQIFSTVGAGRQVAKMVRNHCMVKTLVSGGS